jgi:hypothetical protein
MCSAFQGQVMWRSQSHIYPEVFRRWSNTDWIVVQCLQVNTFISSCILLVSNCIGRRDKKSGDQGFFKASCSTMTLRMHIGRLGGKHFTNYHELCERNGIKPDYCSLPPRQSPHPGAYKAPLNSSYNPSLNWHGHERVFCLTYASLSSRTIK